jgi:hypothetical protein
MADTPEVNPTATNGPHRLQELAVERERLQQRVAELEAVVEALRRDNDYLRQLQDSYERELTRRFADEPIPLERFPANEEEMREALARGTLGDLIRELEGSPHHPLAGAANFRPRSSAQ